MMMAVVETATHRDNIIANRLVAVIVAIYSQSYLAREHYYHVYIELLRYELYIDTTCTVTVL